MKGKRTWKRVLSFLLTVLMILEIAPVGIFAAIEAPNWNKDPKDLPGKKNDWPLESGQSFIIDSGVDGALPILQMNYLGQEGDYAHFITRLSGTSNTANGYNLLLKADTELKGRVDMTGSYFKRNGQEYYLTRESSDEDLVARANLASIFQQGYNTVKPPTADFYLKIGSAPIEENLILQGRFYRGPVGSEQILKYTTLTKLHQALRGQNDYKLYTQIYTMSSDYNEDKMAFGIPKKTSPGSMAVTRFMELIPIFNWTM